jgi:HD-GYP domain-containing protein (c-di-GMP phosphodiesterase class II)
MPQPDTPGRTTQAPFSETYLQISPNILESFPRFRPPVDLYLHDEAVGRVGLVHRAGVRRGVEAQARVADHAAHGRLYLLRDDHLAFAQHLSRRLGVVLVEDSLMPREVAEIFFLAFREGVARFFDQPKQRPLGRLHADIAILAEYLWADPCRVEFLAGALNKDYDQAVHAVNTMFIGLALAAMLSPDSLTRSSLVSLALGLLLHDLGMVNVPRFVVDKEQYLVRRDRESIERHLEAGLRKLDRLGVTDPVVRQCLEQHHERLDGSGYPRGLRGPAITLPGRLCAVADSFSAMIGVRPYHDPRMLGQAAATLAADARYDAVMTRLLAEFVSGGMPACRTVGGVSGGRTAE